MLPEEDNHENQAPPQKSQPLPQSQMPPLGVTQLSPSEMEERLREAANELKVTYTYEVLSKHVIWSDGSAMVKTNVECGKVYGDFFRRCTPYLNNMLGNPQYSRLLKAFVCKPHSFYVLNMLAIMLFPESGIKVYFPINEEPVRTVSRGTETRGEEIDREVSGISYDGQPVRRRRRLHR